MYFKNCIFRIYFKDTAEENPNTVDSKYTVFKIDVSVGMQTFFGITLVLN